MEERPCPDVAQEGLVERLRGHGRRERIHPAGQPLGQTQQVRGHSTGQAGEERAGPPEAGHDLIRDQEDSALVAGRSDGSHDGGVVDPHARRPLQARLEDHPRRPLAQLVQGADDGRRLRGDPLHLEQERREGHEEGVGVAHRHRAEGVAVVAAFERHEDPALGLVSLGVGLERDLQGDLHRGRAVVAEEGPGQPIRGHAGQLLGERDARLMGGPGEEHVIEALHLGPRRLHQPGLPVAVQGRPPGGDPVHQLGPVIEHQRAPLAARTGIGAGSVAAWV